jgi:hypothetical protein
VTEKENPAEKREGETRADAANPNDDQKAEAEEQAPAEKAKYVFKIAPANPRNAFDFEDVADK